MIGSEGAGADMATNYAEFSRNEAYLNQRFGLEMAHLLLGLNNEIIEAIAGRYSRGKRKGQLRGAITWERCIKGGWYRTGYEGCHVEYPGKIRNVAIIDAFTKERL